MFFLINSSVEFLLYTLFIIPIINIAIALLSKENKQFINIATTILAFFLFINLLGLCASYKSINHLSFSLGKIFEIELNFKVEPIGLLFSLITSALWLLNSIYSIGYFKIKSNFTDKTNSFVVVLLAFTVLFTLLIAFSANLFTTYIFYEWLSLCTYVLIKTSNTVKSSKQSNKYLIILSLTSFTILLPAIIYIYHFIGSVSYQPSGIMGTYFSATEISILLTILSLGIVKTAIIILYKQYFATFADKPIIVILHALTVGLSGMIFLAKIIIYIFGIQNLFKLSIEHDYINSPLIIIYCISIVVASYLAYKHNNLKKMLAYVTISQILYCIIILSCFTKKTLFAAILLMTTYVFSCICLFFSTNAIELLTQISCKKNLLGLSKLMKLSCFCFSIAALTIIIAPILIIFYAKFFLLNSIWLSLISEWKITLIICALITSNIFLLMNFVPIIYNLFKPTILSNDLLQKTHSVPFTINIAQVIASLAIVILLSLSNKITNFLQLTSF